MASTDGTVGAQIAINGDTSGLRRALGDAKSSLSSFQAQALGALSRIDSATADLSATLTSLKSTADVFRTGFSLIGLGGAAAGLISVLNQVKASAKEWADAGAAARLRGITPEFMSELKYAAEKMGTATGVASSAMEKFRVKVASLRVEGSASAKSLEAMNAPLLAQIRAAPNQEQALFVVADAMADQKTAADQVRLAAELFGDENVEMIHVLSRGSEALNVWGESAQRAGVIMSKDTTEAAKSLTHALDALERSPTWQWLEEWLIGFVRQTAVIVGGSMEAMSNDEMLRAIEVTETQIRRLEQALKDGAKATDANISAWDQLRSMVVSSINGIVSSARDAALSDTSQQGTILGDLQELVRQLPDQVIPVTDAVEKIKDKLDELRQYRAEAQTMLASRFGWGARQEALDMKKVEGAKTVNTGEADRWSSDLHRKMLGSTQDFYATLEFERDRDLKQFDAYVAELGGAWEGAAQARLDIEAKYDTELARIRDKSVKPFADAISSDLDKAFSSWVETGKLSWDDLARSILADIIKIQVRMAVLQPLFGGGAEGGTGIVGGMIGQAGNWFSGVLANANGNAFSMGEVVPFASGGVVTRPSIFGMRDGQTGLMGEAGPEAIMPLARGSDGRLGVQTSGSAAAPVVHFNVQATDAESFRRSEGQITAMLSRAVARGNRNR